MEAARPSLEPLPDMPVEEGAHPDPARRAQPPKPAGGASAPPPAPREDDADTTRTLEFIDPQLLLATPESAPAAKPAAEPPAQVLEIDPHAPLELALEEPPAPPAATAAKSVPPAPPLGLARPSPVRAAPAPSEAAPVLVPLAKRASLTAAAAKLAAAAAHQPQGPKPAQAVPPPVRPAPAPAAALPVAKPATQPTPAAAAPSLAGWASARAAAVPTQPRAAAPRPTTPPGASPVNSGAAAPAPRRDARAAPPAVAPAAAAPPSAPMDRDFIARNQVIERYLSGRLPLRGATEFERYCREHPQLLDEIGLPDRVNAGLRLLEASGKPEPWEEGPRPLWQRPQFTLGLLAATALLAIVLATVAAVSASKSHRIAELERAAHDRTLDPAASTRAIRLLPSRSGASNTPAITIGGGPEAQLVDFRIDESRSPFRVFRVTIDRIDQGRVMIIDNLTKDSNGHLRIALNSSALGPGNYQLTIEGLTMRLEPQPDSWVTIGVAR